jgi:hypothetical protein
MRRRWRSAVLVAVCALGVRVNYVLRQKPAEALAGDAVEYHSYAVSLLEQGRYESVAGDRATRMPGYPAFLAAVYAAAGVSAAAVFLAQAVLGALACVLLVFAAEALVPDPWPLVCGLAAAFSPDLVAPCGALLSEALYSFALAAFLAALYAGRAGRARAAVCGLAAAGACLIRPEAAPWAVATLAFLPKWIKGFRPKDAALGLAVFAAVYGLWVVRNEVVLHRFLPASSIGHYTMYLGLYLPLEHQLGDFGPMFSPPAGFSELERDALYGQAFRTLFAQLPWLVVLKAYAFDFFSIFYPFLPGYDAPYAILAPFWLFGLWLARRRRELRPIAVLIVLSAAVYTVFGGPVSRYRFGFAPFLILLSVVGLRELRDRLSRRRWNWAVGVWVGFNLAVWAGAGLFRDFALRIRDTVF